MCCSACGWQEESHAIHNCNIRFAVLQAVSIVLHGATVHPIETVQGRRMRFIGNCDCVCFIGGFIAVCQLNAYYMMGKETGVCFGRQSCTRTCTRREDYISRARNWGNLGVVLVIGLCNVMRPVRLCSAQFVWTIGQSHPPGVTEAEAAEVFCCQTNFRVLWIVVFLLILLQSHRAQLHLSFTQHMSPMKSSATLMYITVNEI